MPNVPITANVLMDGRDVSAYVTSIRVSQQPRQLHREWTVTLAGWTHASAAARWDIYAGYGGQREVLVRQGIVPPDWQPVITIGPQDATPTIEVSGVDWAWVAARVRRQDTIVIAPDRHQARRAVRRFEEQVERRPVGRVMYLTAETMHQAITQLGAMAGFTVAPLIPDYRMQGHVCDPRESIWESLWRLVAPFAPLAYFRRERNEVVLADRPLLARAQVASGLGAGLIRDITIAPVRDGYLRRVIVRVPAWLDAAGTA